MRSVPRFDIEKFHKYIQTFVFTATGDVTIDVCKKSSLTLMRPELKETVNEVYSGYLYKKVNSVVNKWNKRWFVLKSDNCLYYYKEKKVSSLYVCIVLPLVLSDCN